MWGGCTCCATCVTSPNAADAAAIPICPASQQLQLLKAAAAAPSHDEISSAVCPVHGHFSVSVWTPFLALPLWVERLCLSRCHYVL